MDKRRTCSPAPDWGPEKPLSVTVEAGATSGDFVPAEFPPINAPKPRPNAVLAMAGGCNTGGGFVNLSVTWSWKASHAATIELNSCGQAGST